MSEMLDFKFDVIDAFDRFSKNELPITIHTSNSLIVGTINYDIIRGESTDELFDKLEELNKNQIEISVSLTNALFEKNREATRKESDVSNAPKGFWLKDVTILFGALNQRVQLNTYFIFIDQVVGVSYGLSLDEKD